MFFLFYFEIKRLGVLCICQIFYSGIESFEKHASNSWVYMQTRFVENYTQTEWSKKTRLAGSNHTFQGPK